MHKTTTQPHTAAAFFIRAEETVRDYGSESEVSRAVVELLKVLGGGICHHLAGFSINESGMLHLN